MSNENSIEYLNYLVRTYKSITDMIASTKNRLQSLPGDHPLKFDRILHGEEKEDGLETIKGRISRLILKELPNWQVWDLWLANVPGTRSGVVLMGCRLTLIIFGIKVDLFGFY